MTHKLPSADAIASETHELYLHLLNLKREDGEPATDAVRLHRTIAAAPSLQDSQLDAASLTKYAAGDQAMSALHLEALRVALDRAHREATDPKFTWKPRWLNTPQGVRNAHPSITNHARHHHPAA